MSNENDDTKMTLFGEPSIVRFITTYASETRLDPNFNPQIHVTGCFRFDDGTTQGWTLNQLYGWYINPQNEWKLDPIRAYNAFTYFNSQNLALAAESKPLLITRQDVQRSVIYLESPDLSNDSNWQGIKGYRMSIHRLLFSWVCPGNLTEKDQNGKPIIDPETGEPKLVWPLYYSAQLQMKAIDTSDHSEHHWGEFDQNTQKFIIHPIEYNQQYDITFLPSQLSERGSGPYLIKQVRVMLTMPGFIGEGELLCNGKWLIGNVCPIKR